MTSKVTLNLPAASVASQPLALATGATVAGIQFTLGNGSEPIIAQAAADGSYSATFDNVADGTYTASAQAIDTLKNLLGAPDVQSVTVTTAPVTTPVPVPTGALTVAVTADPVSAS